MDVYLEVGKKRTFAAAIDWPGWCRSGKDEAFALQALLDYGPRYAQAIDIARTGLAVPAELKDLTVVERLKGNVGTDFGAPVVSPSVDAAPVDEADLERYQALLMAMWRSFDSAVKAAEGKALSTGPRGGGRDLKKIIAHVYEADQGYLYRLGGTLTKEEKNAGPTQGFPVLRQAILNFMGPAARGELPRVGPHGGERWGLRFYVRYSSWHMLDHLWEIEDRVIG